MASQRVGQQVIGFDVKGRCDGWVSVTEKRFAGGADPTGVADSTAAIQAAIDANPRVEIPAGTWLISAITIPANRTIRTAGLSTIFQQKAGTPTGTRILNVQGSNVEIGDVTVRGNIATDTDEQQHGVFIRPASGEARNIRIGRVVGENIRGDAVYIGGTPTKLVYSVQIEAVYSDNVYRDAVSITGGEDIRIGSIVSVRTGAMPIDIEPNAGSSQPCRNIHVGYIKGAMVGVIGLGADVVSNVQIDFLDLDPAYQTNSAPAYPAYAESVKIGLILRSLRGLHVGHYRARNFVNHALKYVYAPGDVNGQNIVLGYVDWDQCSTTDATYNASALVGAVETFEIRGGTVTLQDASKRVIFGDAASPANVRVKVRNLTSNGQIARYVGFSEFDGIAVSNAGFDVYAFRDVQNSTIRNSTITLGRLAGACSRLRFENVTATVGTFLFDTGAEDHFIENSTLNGTLYRSGTYRQVAAPTFGATVAIDAAAARHHFIAANSGIAFTIANPTNPPPTGQRQITIRVKNSSGGALGTVTWGTAYKMSPWTSPATGQGRSVTFEYDGASWIEVGRTPADVPN
jgi:hypothetical protein